MQGTSSVCQQVHPRLRMTELTCARPLTRYFAYVDDKLKLRKDCRFDSRVKQAHWDDKLHVWHVTSDGKDGVYQAAARHLIVCTVRLPLPSSPTTNARLGIRIQAVYSKVERTGNVPGKMDSHSAVAKGRDRDERKTSWSDWDGSKWSTSHPRDWATRTHRVANRHVNPLIAR